MTSHFIEKTDAWDNYQIRPECMKNICSVLFEHLEIYINDTSETINETINETTKAIETTKPPVTSKQLYKDNKRATQVLVARGYHGYEKDIQHVLLQARRRRYW